MKTFSKCPGTSCPRKETCFRYLVEAAPKFQPYICMETSVKNVDECRFYIKNEEKNNVT